MSRIPLIDTRPPDALKMLDLALQHQERDPKVHLVHPCSRCLELHCEDPRVPVREAERLVEDGRPYWSWGCTVCTDIEWSMRWTKAYAKATTGEERSRLERQKLRWLGRGRQVYE